MVFKNKDSCIQQARVCWKVNVGMHCEKIDYSTKAQNDSRKRKMKNIWKLICAFILLLNFHD